MVANVILNFNYPIWFPLLRVHNSSSTTRPANTIGGGGAYITMQYGPKKFECDQYFCVTAKNDVGKINGSRKNVKH